MCVRDACEPRARLKLGVGTHLCVQVAYFVFLREVTGAPRNAHSHSAFSDFSRDLASKHEIRDLDPYLSATVRYRARAPLERTAAPPPEIGDPLPHRFRLRRAHSHLYVPCVRLACISPFVRLTGACRASFASTRYSKSDTLILEQTNVCLTT